jgi:hypothetical protein
MGAGITIIPLHIFRAQHHRAATALVSAERNGCVPTNVLPPMRCASPVLLTALALLTACSSKQDTVLEAVKGAHSVTAEWAAVERLAAEGRVTRTYRSEMRDKAKDQHESERRGIPDANAPAARAIDAALRDPAPSPASLAATAKALGVAEKKLEAR